MIARLPGESNIATADLSTHIFPCSTNLSGISFTCYDDCSTDVSLFCFCDCQTCTVFKCDRCAAAFKNEGSLKIHLHSHKPSPSMRLYKTMYHPKDTSPFNAPPTWKASRGQRPTNIGCTSTAALPVLASTDFPLAPLSQLHL